MSKKDESSTPAEEPKADPVVSTPNPPAGETAATTGKTFTQEELNQIIAQRLQQERSKFVDYDAIKAQNEQLTSERAAEQQRVADLQKANETLMATQQKTATEAAIIQAAAKLGLDAEAAIALAKPSDFKLSEQGVIENADDIAKGIAERFPGLTKRPVPPQAAVNPPDSGDRQVQVAPEVADARRRATYFGGGGGASGFWGGGGVRLPVKDD